MISFIPNATSWMQELCARRLRISYSRNYGKINLAEEQGLSLILLQQPSVH
jgi:hypothetical protein